MLRYQSQVLAKVLYLLHLKKPSINVTPRENSRQHTLEFIADGFAPMLKRYLRGVATITSRVNATALTLTLVGNAKHRMAIKWVKRSLWSIK